MAQVPEIRYARTESGEHIAYQTIGDGPFDLVFFPEWISNIEVAWESPAFAGSLRRLSSFCRLIWFDKLGTGLSDPLPADGMPTLEQWMEDVQVVMRAVGSQAAAVLGTGFGALMSVVFAASHPQRVQKLALVNAFVRPARAPDYSPGMPPSVQEWVMRNVAEGWGHGAFAEIMAPRMDAAWFARYQRASASPGVTLKLTRAFFETDVRDVLPIINAPTGFARQLRFQASEGFFVHVLVHVLVLEVPGISMIRRSCTCTSTRTGTEEVELPGKAAPTLIVHRTDELWARVDHGRYLAKHIPGARYVELPGRAHFLDGEDDPILDEIEEFLTGTRHRGESNRILATVLFVDIVDSTAQAARLGDDGWRKLLEGYYEMARRQTRAARGREINTVGDGYFAAFDGPGRAVRAAAAIRDAAEEQGFQVRAGLHTGECERIGDDLAGIAVHLGARVADKAAAGEVLVSSTVKDLVAGSGLRFTEGRIETLKGIPGQWRLFRLEPEGLGPQPPAK